MTDRLAGHGAKGKSSLRECPKTLDAFCLDHIARFKRPKRYEIVEALPKNNYGNVLKTVLREGLQIGK
ncbi:hypothetical protein [Hydrogenophaga taeniospiralis]|uniref:hypothetical protein n=1 Tax=Hydrogenophaga taeniospiralis TaxID=65656 RepID=UPI001CFB1413|nr:hypothetical protein [Hydrogenophaga taeniospiralis]MDP2019653.1 hypothetical protein [Hydrogenophaga sp.]UCU93518.1 hypothetical protein KI616_22560 [Hydrogenophaga taeniospiralis]